MGAELDNFERLGIRAVVFSSQVTHERDALEVAGARDELRELGAECLRQAQAADDDPVAADWYAAASDLYLRAGDRERARELARLGLPFVAGRLQRAMESYSNVDKTNPTAMAIAAQGSGTSPVVALYRTGAIEEALKTRYLTGKDRYLNADRAGEKKDPQWVIDDNWTLYLNLMAREAARSDDRAFQQRAYDGLVRSCGKPLADCFDETLRNIAEVAAGMGDETRMKEALAAAARQLDQGIGMGFQAMYVAGRGRIARKYCAASEPRLELQATQ